MAIKKQAHTRLDRIFDGVDNPLWAERTRTRHRNLNRMFLVWQEYHGFGTSTGSYKNKKMGNEAKGIARFIKTLTREVSSEAMLSNTRSLLKTLRHNIKHKKAESNKGNASNMTQRRQTG